MVRYSYKKEDFKKEELNRRSTMKYMMIFTLTLMTSIFAQFINPETGWSYEQATQQSFYMLQELLIDGQISEGDGTAPPDALSGDCYNNAGTCDVIGAFIDRSGTEVCVGWTYAKDNYSTVPLMGNDQNSDYLASGEAAYLKVYDATYGSILDISPNSELPGFALNQIQLISGSSSADNTFGCTDASACNYDSDATANDGSCASEDCFGECGGSAVEDDCGVCNGGNADQDCAGVCFGPNVDTWCDGSCGESGPEDDGCGVCDGDNSSCTGCTNSDADNFDSGNLFDDGSCSFTVPGATNLTAEGGPARAYLAWDAPSDDFSSSVGYKYHVSQDGEFVKTVTQTSTQVTGLDGGSEYCFTILAEHNAYGFSEDASNEACATPQEVVGPTWRLQLVATIDSYDQFQFSGDDSWLLTDDQNYLGVAGDASWGYDPSHDAPEPPNGPGNFIRLFFDHPEWDEWVTHFTEDIVLDDDNFFSTNLTQWDGRIESDVPGTTTITFHVETGQVPANYEMYVLLEDHHEGHDGVFHRINHDGETSISFYMDGSGQQNFSVFIGNIPPQAPDNLTSEGHYSSITLDWDEDGDDLSDIGNRYPALSYNVYRDDSPSDPDSNSGNNDGNGPGGCGGLLTGSDGQGNSDYNDDADIYAEQDSNLQGEGLLQESTYSYTVTGSNLAGESSEGHTIRTSGGQDTFYAGRSSETSSTTGTNQSPVSLPTYQPSPNGSNYCIDVLAGCDDGYWDWNQGIYEIPHNNDPDANKIGIKLNAWDSYDPDYPYSSTYYFWYTWTQVEGSDDLSGIIGTSTPELTFSVDNAHADSDGNDNESKFYTWNLNTRTEHPIKDPASGACGDWRTVQASKSDDQTIEVEIRPEPNANPIAASAQDLIRGADGISVTTSDQYDESDFNDYDAEEGKWFEPHNNSGDQNDADLWFTAYNSDDPDGMCLGDGPPTCVYDCQGFWDIFDGSGSGNPVPNEEISDNDICTWVVDIVAASGCADDCDANQMSDVNEITNTCSDCLASDGDCTIGGCPEGTVEDCDGEGCIVEDWIGDGWCDDGSYGAVLTCYDNDGGDCDESANNCPDGYIEDCNADACAPANWLGDGLCDDGAYGAVLTCYDNDDGDCSDDGDSSDEDENDGPPECILTCPDIDTLFGNSDADQACEIFDSWVGTDCYSTCDEEILGELNPWFDGCSDCLADSNLDCSEVFDHGDEDSCEDYCMDSCSNLGTGGLGDCSECDESYTCNPEACDFNGGSCNGQGSSCEDLGGLDDCDGSGECAPSSYLGDGWCDGEDQLYGFDLSCYDNDSGDCADDSADEEGSSDGCENDYSAYGAADCDDAWGAFGIDCATLSSYYNWDCSGCSCPGDERNVSTKKFKLKKDHLTVLTRAKGIVENNSRSAFNQCDEQSYEWSVTSASLAGFSYTDLDENGQFDIGEPFVLTGSDEVYEGTDLGNYTTTSSVDFEDCLNCWGGYYSSSDDSEDVGVFGHNGMDLHAELPNDIYILTMTVTDIYGDSDHSSLLFIVEDERNEGPTVGDLREQETYYISYDKDTRQTEVGGCDADNLTASDSDNDDLAFNWDYSYDAAGTEAPDGDGELSYNDGDDDSEYQHLYNELVSLGDNGWNNIAYDLEEGDHTFTFTATDSYGESASSSTTISVRREPDAAHASVSVIHEDLKYVTVEVSDNDLATFDSDECYGEVYDGDLDNTRTIELYNDGNLIETFRQGDDGEWLADADTEGEDTFIQIDKHLEAETTYNYTVQSYNDDGQVGAFDEDESSVLATTGNRPMVEVLTPNGAEIRSISDLYDIDFSTTDPQYISRIEVFYLRDGVSEEDGTDQSGSKVESNTGTNSGGVAPGNNTNNFEISDDTGVEVNYDAKIRIRVHDVGDYDGLNVETNSDDSNNPFTMAAHTISNNYAPGWHLLGSPLVAYNETLVDNFSGSFGQWGSIWVAYDVDGIYDGLEINLGEGYYVALKDSLTLTLEGDPVIADPDCNDCDDNSFESSDISLDRGWNLIANPLVNKVDKETFILEFEGNELEFDDAVDAGWIAPTIYGWFENSYESIERIMPFGGYFVNTSRDLTLKVRPHLFDDGELTRKNQDIIAGSLLELRARDISGNGISDFIQVGLLEGANDDFEYGEDEFDLPRYAYSSMGGEYIDLKVGADLMKDMRSSEYEEFQAWNISVANQKVDNDIELSWGDVSGFEDALYMIINGEVINMQEESSVEISSVIDEVAIVVGNVDAYLNPIPSQFGLGAAYPNPFNPTTNLGLALHEDGLVSMSVFNIRGQVVEVLVDNHMKAGYHNVTWNADGISSGMYFVRVEAGTHTAMQKLMLLK